MEEQSRTSPPERAGGPDRGEPDRRQVPAAAAGEGDGAREPGREGDALESDPDAREELLDVDRMIGAFLRESSLWPVLVVILGSGGAFTAALLVLAFVDRNPFAAAALILIFGMTVDVCHRARTRPSHRNGALLLGLLWATGLVFAGFAVWSGIAFSG